MFSETFAMNVLPKNSVFKIFQSMLKRSSVCGIEKVQSSFDGLIIQSLEMVQSQLSDKHLRKMQCLRSDSRYIMRDFPLCREDMTTSANFTDDGDKGMLLGQDRLKPFDIIVAFQILALQCKSFSNVDRKSSILTLFRGRLHSLTILTCFYLEEFSFIKISLLLNSLANILNTKIVTFPTEGLPEVVTNGSDEGNEKEDLSYHKFYSLSALCRMLGDYNLESSLYRLNKDIESRFLLKLWSEIYFSEEPEYLRLDVIDVHSICIILKYYSSLKHIDDGLLYLIFSWLKKLDRIPLIDKMNIVISLSKFTLKEFYDTFDFRNTECGILCRILSSLPTDSMSAKLFALAGRMSCSSNNSISNVGTMTLFPHNIICLILSKLKDTVDDGKASLDLIHRCLHAIINLKTKCICDKVILEKLARDAIKYADITLEDKLKRDHVNIADFGSLLYGLYLSSFETNLIDLFTVRSFFFTKRKHGILFMAMLEICERRKDVSIKTLGNIAAFLNGLKAETKHLSAKEHNLVKGLLDIAAKAIPAVLSKSDSSFLTIYDVINLSTLAEDDRLVKTILQQRLFNIYSDAFCNSRDNRNLLQLYRQTTELFRYSLQNNWEISKGLHRIIERLLSGSFKEVALQNFQILLGLLQRLSRFYRRDNELLHLYNIKLILSHCMDNVECDLYISVFIDIIFNTLLNENLKPTDVVSLDDLEHLLTGYHSKILKILDSLNSADESSDKMTFDSIDISTFAKFVHVAWLSKDLSICLSQIWDGCLFILLDRICSLKNRRPPMDATGDYTEKRTDQCLNKGLNCQNWQSFSANIVIAILLKIKTGKIPHGEEKAPIDPENLQRAIDFIFESVCEFTKNFGDNTSSVAKLSNLIVQNQRELMNSKDLENVSSILHSITGKNAAKEFVT